MVAAGLQASLTAVYRARMKAFRQDPMLRHIDAEVCRIFQPGDPQKIIRIAHDAYFNTPVRRLKLFRGTRPLLRFLKQRGVRIFVVSFGEPHIQRAKVRALGLDREPAIEQILYADRGKLLTKEAAFARIQRLVGLPANEILVAGDRPMREIRAGNELGMHTVRLRHGEFAAQEPRDPEEKPDFEIGKIAEVMKLPFVWNSDGSKEPLPSALSQRRFKRK
jgi:FMN phosphatase YigB (HAD superfamily)